MNHKLKLLALASMAVCGTAMAAQTGGFATTDGGNVSGAKTFTAKSHTEINTILANAMLDSAGKKVKGGAYPVIITYTGNEDSLINQVIRDHTVDASGNCPKARWNDAYREVQIKEFTKGITIQGANGSSANFGITMIKSANIIIRNMKIGALAGAKNDADALRIDNTSNVWITHNELFAVNNECKGSPDGDLTFESLLDIKKDAKNITVSYNIIRDSKKVGLMGHTQSGGSTDFYRTVTFHHNIYRNVNGRLPLQRGGVMHAYNNLYSGITGSGINVRANGVAVVERNWFENSKNPLTCRFDTNGCGKWHLIANNVSNSASNATYKISWDSPGSGGINAENWTSTQSAKPSLPYPYEPVSAQCVKDRLHQYVGVGKNGAQLTAAACSGSASSSSASSSSSSSSSATSSSSSAASGAINLSAIAGSGSISLSWSPAAITLGSQEVYRDTDADPKGRVRIASLASSARSYTDSTAVRGTTYYYWIKNTTSGTVTNSNAASATIGAVSSSSSSSAASSSSSSSASGAPALSGSGDYPSGFSKCADAGKTCSVSKGTGWVAFGRKGKWVAKHVGVGKSISCSVSAFGSDPGGNPNKCSFQN